MKYLSLILCCVLAFVMLSLPALASDPEPAESADPAPTETEEVVTDVDETFEQEEVSADDGSSDAGSSESDASGADVPIVEVDGMIPIVYDVVPVEVTSRSPLLDAMTALFGNYQPRTYMVSTYLEDGTIVSSEEIVPGLAGLDWEWVVGAGLFIMSLYCIFKVIGGLLKWK